MGFINNLDELLHKSARKLAANEPINGVEKVFAHYVSALDKASEFLTGTNVLSRLDDVASGAAEYGFGDAVRFGLQTYAGINIPLRLISGGGIYRDSSGEFDIIGVPFI